MSKKLMSLILMVVLVFGSKVVMKPMSVQASTMRRIIDNNHPVNLVSYYGEDNETIPELWSSIPDEMKPYTVLFIICGHKNIDADKNLIEQHVSICQQNNIPCLVQVVNGETKVSEHIPISFLEELIQKYSCVIGLNGAELYNSIKWYGESEGNHSQYLADLVNMVSNYDAYFMWTDTNIFGTNGTIIDWIENNQNLINALRTHRDNFIMIYKESYGSLNTDSVLLGLWLSGLASNWGISSDWWHWQVDGYQKLFGEPRTLFTGGWKMPLTWPESLYVSSILRGMSEGATCFFSEASFYSVSLHGKHTPAFTNAIMPLWSKIIDGTYKIPSKQEVLDKNKFTYVGNTGYSVPYESPYSNLYMSNGRYGIIPVIPANCNDTEKANFENLSTTVKDKAYFDTLYPKEVMEGNTFASRIGDQWIWMNSSENTNVNMYSKIKPQINTSEFFMIEGTPHTSLILKESENRFVGHISNYRVDKDALWGDLHSWEKDDAIAYIKSYSTPGNPNDHTLRTTKITMKGSYDGQKPLLTISGKEGMSYTEDFDSIHKIYTLTIQHNGPVDFEITADGSVLSNNLALDKEVSSSVDDSGVNRSFDSLVDGVSTLTPSQYMEYTGNGEGNQYIDVDLGGVYPIDSLHLTRFYVDGRIYNDTVMLISTDPNFSTEATTVVYNANASGNLGYGNGTDSPYVETQGGHWVDLDNIVEGRYVRIWSNGSNVNSSNQYVELEVYGDETQVIVPTPSNVAISKTVTSSATTPGDNRTFASLVDGIKSITPPQYLEYIGNGNGKQYIQVDLGESYPIDAINLTRYYLDERIYKDTLILISDDSSFSIDATTVVYNANISGDLGYGAGTDSEYPELSGGKTIDMENPVEGRYVRIWSNGSNVNSSNHFVELEVMAN
ncbi:hypothetical protein AN1V17_32680 [Vallitalea sediminicola]